MADTLITDAFVVDGTGRPGELRDIGIRDSRFVPVDELGANPRVVDAGGLVATPGFIDVHTHYDAQLSWDPTASPSPLHGVTTVLGGNCGFTLAPAGDDHAGYLMRMMARVEGMPLAALEAGLSWDWSTYEDWAGRLDGAIGVNAGFLVGHSTVRRVVMGDDCHDAANATQVELMARIVRDACAAGALGFSTSTAPTHNDAEGAPVPSRGANPDELAALAGAVRDAPGTTLECILAGSLSSFSSDEKDLFVRLSLAANRPINWNVLSVSNANPDGYRSQLAASDYAAERGARVVALTMPHSTRVRLSFLSGMVFDGLPGWRPVFALPRAERKRALMDPDLRRRLAEGAASKEAGVLGSVANWPRFRLIETFAPENREFEGRVVGDLVAERGGDPFDFLLDIIIADDLRTGLSPADTGETLDDYKLRADVWLDPRTVIGGSDAGAHLDMMCGAVYSTALLQEGVREFGVISLEQAVHQLTDVPARLYGLKDRGTIADGGMADLVLFDPARVGFEDERLRDDLPGGASRLYAEATGIHQVLVNGVVVVDEGSLTGELPGTLLRSGRDTQTVTP